MYLFFVGEEADSFVEGPAPASEPTEFIAATAAPVLPAAGLSPLPPPSALPPSMTATGDISIYI